jgi:dihydroflavonol-4-reductase
MVVYFCRPSYWHYWTFMRALITGATGFIGSHLAEQLHAKGYDLKVLTRPTSDTKYIRHLPVEYVGGTLSNAESLKDAVSGVDYIYHVAGVVASKNREGFFQGNQIATRNLLEATRQYNPELHRFVHVSSQAAVGPATGPESPVDETAAPHPITTYGESKAAAEQEVFQRMDQLPLTIVRPPAVYGPRDIGVFSFFKTMAQMRFAPLIGFGAKLVSLVHVEDLVRGFIQAGESPRAQSEAYFISSEELYTWEQVGKITAEILGHRRVRFLRVPHAIIFAAAGLSGFVGRFSAKPPILDFEKGRDITQAYWICSVEKAKEHFGYRQLVSVEQGVRQTVEWYRREGWL